MPTLISIFGGAALAMGSIWQLVKGGDALTFGIAATISSIVLVANLYVVYGRDGMLKKPENK